MRRQTDRFEELDLVFDGLALWPVKALALRLGHACRWPSGLLPLLLPLALPATAEAQFAYAVTNGTITSSDYTGSGGAVIIPSAISGLPVTSIGNSAFFGSSLTGVTIPSSVTSIGVLAFDDCTNLTSVTIPASVTSIGEWAFQGCISLTNAYFQGNAPNADSSVFSGDNNATVYYLPGSIGWGSPFGGLPTVVWNPQTQFHYAINNGAITVTGYAGSGDAVTIPSAVDGLPVTSIGWGSFSGCTSLTSVTIPNSVTSVGGGAFEYCTSLTSVTIPVSVTSIGYSAFVGCTSLASVTVPAGVTSIGETAFDDCLGLTNVYFQGNAPSVGWGVFNGDNATVYYLPGTTGWGPTFSGLPTALWNRPPPAPIRLQVQKVYALAVGELLVLTWTNSAFALQAAPTVTGGYPNVSGAASPYAISAAGPQRFFRLDAN